MAKYVDLHLHSTYSDGVLTPVELVERACEAGLAAIALADHDNIDGIPEAVAAGVEAGLEVIAGVELSVIWEELDDIHLLGYGFDFRHPDLVGALGEFRAFRANRNRLILEKVNAQLVKQGRSTIDFSLVRQRAGGTLGRPHIAQALVAEGHVKDMEDAFDRYLVPCNVPKRFFPIDEAVDLIHQTGGCAVLAHPPYVGVSGQRFLDMLDVFIGLGLDGLEAYNPGCDNNGIDTYITLARQRGLIVTGGSDFHQPEPGGLELGVGRGNLKIPYQCIDEIRTACSKYSGG